MSKLKVIIGLGVAALGLTLLGDAKKASASTVPATPEPPATPPVPAKKPTAKPAAKRKASALTESDAAAAAAKLTPEQCADKLAQVAPIIEGGRASESVLTQAWAWAQRAKTSADPDIKQIAVNHSATIDAQLKKMSYRGDETPSDR